MGNTSTLGNDRNIDDYPEFGSNCSSQYDNYKERTRYGVVNVTCSITGVNNTNRNSSNEDKCVATPKGVILFGSANANETIKNSITSISGRLAPTEILLPDNRAHRLLVIHSNRWYLIPSTEIFSRHSGVCLVLGDRHTSNPPMPVKLGDCFRFGSVGLVVSEIKYENSNEQRLDSKTLQYLRDEASAIDNQEDLAALAAEENLEEKKGTSRESDIFPNSPSSPDSLLSFPRGLGLTNGERFICYMCYETHDTPEDPLVAPCECKGDTRYLHVQCMQKWYYANASATQAQVIRTTSNGAAACKICGAAYKSAFKNADGKRASLLETNPDGPYISLVVVTKHDSSPTLFNTKFRLRFGSNSLSNEDNDRLSTLLIGRSTSCNMILDYRTVSTVHAKLSFIKNQFFLEDCSSSNGTMVYLREPVYLPYNKTVKIRNGRSTLTFSAKRSWAASFRDAIFSKDNTCTSSTDASDNKKSTKCFGDSSTVNPTPEQLMSIMSEMSTLVSNIKHRNNSPTHCNDICSAEKYNGPKDNNPNSECRPCEGFQPIQIYDDFINIIATTDDINDLISTKPNETNNKVHNLDGLDSSPSYLPHKINSNLADEPTVDIFTTNSQLYSSPGRRTSSSNKSISNNDSPNHSDTNNEIDNNGMINIVTSANSYNSDYNPSDGNNAIMKQQCRDGDLLTDHLMISKDDIKNNKAVVRDKYGILLNRIRREK